MSCSSPGATHHCACDCREADWAAKLAAAEAARRSADERANEEQRLHTQVTAEVMREKSLRIAAEARCAEAEATSLDLEMRLSGLLDRLTNGLFSKTGYSVDQMEQMVDEAYEKLYAEDRAAAESEVGRLRGALRRVWTRIKGCECGGDNCPAEIARKALEEGSRGL